MARTQNKKTFGKSVKFSFSMVLKIWNQPSVNSQARFIADIFGSIKYRTKINDLISYQKAHLGLVPVNRCSSINDKCVALKQILFVCFFNLWVFNLLWPRLNDQDLCRKFPLARSLLAKTGAR